MDQNAVLEVSQLSKTFGGVQALDNVSFRVRPHQILALIGPNGAGKTTLLNVVAGSLAPTSGSVLLNGLVLDGAPPHERACLGIARTHQQAFAFSDMTVLQNAMVGCHQRGHANILQSALRTRATRLEEEEIYLDAMHYLNLVGLGAKANTLAGGLTFGQKRLLAMARALASRPKLILLDEPAAGLNRMEKNDLAELIQRMREMEITIVLVEHDMELVMRLAEWVVVLNYGQRIAQGSPAEVRHNPEVVSAYLGTEGH